MAIIIRSDVALSSPRPGSVLLPPLGVPGATHRWHADAVVGATGSVLTHLDDVLGSAHMTNGAGTVVLRETTAGDRYLDFSTGQGDGNTQNRLYGGSGAAPADAYTLAGLIYWESAPGSAYGVLNSTSASSTQALSIEAERERIAAYGGDSGPILYASPTSRRGWHTAVVTYRRDGQESISLDGGAVARGEVHNSATPNNFRNANSFGVSGRPEQKVRVRDFAYFPRALSDAEHAKVHAALAEQIPT